MEALAPVAADLGAAVTLGVNLDDLGDHRPGQEAARQRGARFPLVDAGMHKSDIRALARQWGLPIWDRPAMPCLSSRVPYGTPVTVRVLSRIDRAEAELRRRVGEGLAGSPGHTMSQIRDLLGTSRKYALPMCEYLDRIGFTRRQDDIRVLA